MPHSLHVGAPSCALLGDLEMCDPACDAALVFGSMAGNIVCIFGIGGSGCSSIVRAAAAISEDAPPFSFK
jgi:hypothetical protein